MLKINTLMNLMVASGAKEPLVINNYDGRGHFVSIPMELFDNYRNEVGEWNVTSICTINNALNVDVEK